MEKEKEKKKLNCTDEINAHENLAVARNYMVKFNFAN